MAEIDDGESVTSSNQDGSQLDGSGMTKKYINGNAKTVECFDMEGNLVAVYESGSHAGRELGIVPTDVSLCCRGIKDSVSGYRFRFQNGGVENKVPVKKGECEEKHL